MLTKLPTKLLDRHPRKLAKPSPGRIEQPSSQSVGLPIAGSVAAGVWVEPATGNIGQQFAVIPADPRYPAQHQSAWEVRDNSIDRVARPGDFLIVVDRLAAELPLRTGDLVIVTRQKSDLHEITSRRFAADFEHGPRGCRLDFELSDPRRAVRVVVRDVQETDPNFSIGGVVVSVDCPLILNR